jgi:hypothetical protein
MHQTKEISAVFLQEQPDGSLRPCSYYAKTLNKAQRKYHIYDQELLAIAVVVLNLVFTSKDVRVS